MIILRQNFLVENSFYCHHFKKMYHNFIMNIEKIEILEILKEIAQNEHEEYKAFKERFVEYCTIHERAIIKLIRVLNSMEIELKDCLDGRVQVNVDRAIVKKVHKIVKTEIKVIRYRMKCPELFEYEDTHEDTHEDAAKAPKPAGTWTCEKIDLTELIFAIQMSVNHGTVTFRALQRCFEYIFQVKLGNIHKRLGRINERKRNSKTGYLETLITNLNQILDNLNR